MVVVEGQTDPVEKFSSGSTVGDSIEMHAVQRGTVGVRKGRSVVWCKSVGTKKAGGVARVRESGARKKWHTI